MQNKESYLLLLGGPSSRTAIDLVTNSAGDDPEVFEFLVRLITHGEDPFPRNATWALDSIDMQFPDLIIPYLKTLIQSANKFQQTGTLRNILKILSRKNIPAAFHGKLIHHCFEWLYDKKIPVAVKVYAMQIIMNLSEEYPELKQELGEALEDMYLSSSPGFKARANKILRSLKRI